MKKHLDLEVTGLTALSHQQFSQYHETPLADLGLRPVEPWEETHLRKTHREVGMDVTKRVPHSRLRAGQMVVSTQRAQEMAENGIDSSKGNPVLDQGPVLGRQLPDGDVMLRDGHHRVVADMLRGKKSSLVHIDSRWEKP